MKSLFSLMAAVLLAGQLASAKAELTPGSFKMFNTPKPDLTCDRGTSLVLDQGAVMGPVALMSDFLSGFCEIYVYPNPRYVNITTIKNDGCGSKILLGTYVSSEGTVNVEIIDNRGRLCEDVIPALIVMKISGHEAAQVEVLYSDDRK